MAFNLEKTYKYVSYLVSKVILNLKYRCTIAEKCHHDTREGEI
jgi:hypothetical protein